MQLYSICCLTMRLAEMEVNYQPCCRKTLCHGFLFVVHCSSNDDVPCPFCRTDAIDHFSDNEVLVHFEKRIALNDANTMYNLGKLCNSGRSGVKKDQKKAFELWTRAAELGNINRNGVKFDPKKVYDHIETAAI